jgi:hypothetical protein
MLITSKMRVVSVEHASLVVLDDEFDFVEITDGKAIPDLDDPATLGCLLALVRRAWNDQRINTLPTTDGGWAVADGDDDWICTGTTEAEALVGALEAAP